MKIMLGKQSVQFENPPMILSAAAVTGPKEGQGPLGACFDRVWEDELCGAKSWEKAESLLQEQALQLALQKKKLPMSSLRYLLAGDLINQITPSHFAARDTQVPFLGIYGACSTMGLGLSLGAMLVAGGYADCLAAEASSHYCTSEKQFRTPLGYGSQRPLYATWTVTGCGAVILGRAPAAAQPGDVFVTGATNGKIVDYGIKDAFNMGGAMAPAAIDTLETLFRDTHTDPQDYDLIVTGDLGTVGHSVVKDLMARDGFDMDSRYTDCGLLLFDRQKQDMHAGGSGAGCSASVLCSYLLPGLKSRRWKRMIFAPTGALQSPTTVFQKETMPAVCHAVVFSTER